MTLDERAKGAAADVLDRLTDVDVPRVTEIIRRRQLHHRRRVFTAVAAGLALIAIIAVVINASTRARVRTTTSAGEGSPAGSFTDDGWASIPKEGAGLGRRAAINALASTGSAVIAGGGQPSGDHFEPLLRWSRDGIHWIEPEHPPSTGEVHAVGTHGETVVAIGSTSDASSGEPATAFVWSSTNGGTRWTAVAEAPDLFGTPAPSMGRPFVSGVRWSDAGYWVASGGASDGHGGIWTSRDLAHWQSVAPAHNQAGSFDIVDDGHGGLLAYWTTLGWTSRAGDSWALSPLNVPIPYDLASLAEGADIAIGTDVNAGPTAPTPLLRSDNGGRTWTVVQQFVDQFPEAVGLAVARYGDTEIVTGSEGTPSHVDAWVSTNTATWHELPSALRGPPGGTLSLTAEIGGTIVMMGSAPELDRYYTFDTTSQPLASSSTTTMPTANATLGVPPGLSETPFRLDPAMDRQNGVAFQWAGDRLLVVTDNRAAAYFADGTRQDLPPLPVAGLASGSFVWTGSELVVAPGPQSRLGAAYRPSSNTWRRIAESPLAPRASVATVWTGDEMIVWGSRDQTDARAGGAAYDPVTDRWRTIADAPTEFDIGNGVWTGHELVVVGVDQSGNNFSTTPTALAMAYDPTADTWRSLPDTPLNPQAPWVAWTGTELVAWDYGGGATPQASTLTPGDASWSPIETIPLQAGECYPGGAAAHQSVFMTYCGRAATRDPVTGSWSAVDVFQKAGTTNSLAVTDAITALDEQTLLILGSRDDQPVVYAYRTG